MKHMLRFKILCACFSCYIIGDFLGSLFILQNNKIALVLMVMIPTIVLLAYISLLSRQVQPRKKKLPTRRNVRIAR